MKTYFIHECGDADIHLVSGTFGRRDKKVVVCPCSSRTNVQGGVNVRRIENKLGIHGSPTCELVYKNAKV
ncbi:hypothetical protein [Bacteroides acidifaciens]|uniref:hypothetical protein n=1 Tax=Bacteroides acidifaciens TaxID=85831 RepID=UPI003F692CCA